MKALCISFVALSVIGMASARTKTPTVWTETAYYVQGQTNHFATEGSFSLTQGFFYPYYDASTDHFTVTGSTVQAPPAWRNPFTALASNTWQVTCGGTFTAKLDGTATYDHEYETNNGYETFSGDDGSTAARNEDEKVTSDIYLVITYVSGNPGGGGS